jgi:hypothetical protein
MEHDQGETGEAEREAVSNLLVMPSGVMPFVVAGASG